MKPEAKIGIMQPQASGVVMMTYNYLAGLSINWDFLT